MSEPEAGRCVWSWLHVSDIHANHGTAAWKYDQQLVLAGVIRDIPPLQADGAPRVDAILCTGDIAATGALVVPTEYEEARRWVAELSAATNTDSFYSVPGNHDVQRTQASPAAPYRLLYSLREARDSIDAAYDDAGDAAVLQQRFANYERFISSVGAPQPDGPGGTWSAELSGHGHEVRLVGFNTPVLSNDDSDRGSLYIGAAPVAAAFARRTGDELVIVLGHHPLDWLADTDQSKLEAQLFQDADLYLHGHIHTPRSRLSVSGDGSQLVTVSAGAIHGDEPGSAAATHGYSITAIYELGDGRLVARVWPRQWDDDSRRFIRGANTLPGGAYAEHVLGNRRPTPPRTSVGPPPPAAGVRALSKRLIDVWGRRRTAFPTDMSLAELHERTLVVPPRLSSTFSGRNASLDSLARALHDRASILVLGDPGSGKSVLMYELALHLLAEACAPLPISLTDIIGEATDSVAALARVLAGQDVDVDAEVLVLLDGVDETLASGIAATEVARTIDRLAAIGGLIVSCRSAEYEMDLASVMSPDLFSTIVEVQDWKPEDFALFVARLVDEGLLEASDLLKTVASSASLSEIVRRPLLARMLTYLAQDGELPETAADLYQQYIGKLSLTASATLARIGCGGVPEPSQLWRDVAWHLFRSPALRADRVPLDKVVDLFRSRGFDVQCSYRALAALMDVSPATAPPLASFIHYSFYEFLIAQNITLELTRAFSDVDSAQAADLFSKDLPKEIRRHLTAMLRSSAIDTTSWPSWLSSVYRSATGSGDHVRIVRNLVAYILCRLGAEEEANAALSELLTEESDPFLQNSLLWALTRGDDRRALLRYVSQLREDEVLASLNRGYLLYYFGDLLRSTPPFYDNAPHTSWGHTRDLLASRFTDPAYARTPPSRQVIDLYTFYDLAGARSQRLTETEETAVSAIELQLAQHGLPLEALAALREKHATVRPT